MKEIEIRETGGSGEVDRGKKKRDLPHFYTIPGLRSSFISPHEESQSLVTRPTTTQQHDSTVPLILNDYHRYYGGEVKTYVSIMTTFLLSTVALGGEVFPQKKPQESTHVVICPHAGLPGQEISLTIYLKLPSEWRWDPKPWIWSSPIN